MKKVLHLITGLERGGGAEAMIAKTLPYLKNTENRVCVLGGKGEIGEDLEMKGIKIYSLGAKSIFDFRIIKRYKRVLADFQPDVQVNYLIHADIFGRLLAKRFGVKTLVSYIRNRHIKPLFTFLDRITLGRVDYLLTNSESVLAHYRDKYHFPAERSSAIPNGVYLSALPPAFDQEKFKRELGIKEGEKVITCVASFMPQKDHPTLLRAIKLMIDRGKKDFKVFLIGEGKEKENIYSLWCDLRLEDQVIFLGIRDDVEEILAISEAFVLPSLHEGMSNALLEAMAGKVPAIVSSIPENEELISHNETGLVFKTGGPDSLADNLIYALENPAAMRLLAENARLLIEKKYDIKKIIEALDVFLLLDFQPKKEVKVIYIAGLDKSGAADLARSLSAAKNVFWAPELKTLKKDLEAGSLIGASDSWNAVISEIKAKKYEAYDSGCSIDKKVAWAIIFGQPFLIKKFNDREIFSLILEKAKLAQDPAVEYILDSSGDLKRLISLAQDKRIDLYAIHNVRDARGYIADREQKAFDWLRLFFRWLLTNFLISVFLGRFVEKGKIMTIGRDSFILEPERHQREIGEKFSLLIDESKKDISIDQNKIPDISEIEKNEQWKKKFPVWKKKFLSILCALPNQIWVYHDR